MDLKLCWRLAVQVEKGTRYGEQQYAFHIETSMSYAEQKYDKYVGRKTGSKRSVRPKWSGQVRQGQDNKLTVYIYVKIQQ